MKLKFLLSIFLFVLLIGFASAADIAYIHTGDEESKFTEAMDDLGLSYDVIFHAEILPNYDFSEYKIILIGDSYFVNWDRIPINDMSCLVVGSSNVVDWGWATSLTLESELNGVYTDIDTSHEIATGIEEDFKVYNINPPDVYILDKLNIFEGFELIASNPKDNKDAMVALARKGTTLTHTGKPDTEINANSIFFGMNDCDHWSDETEQLFKNSLWWLYEEEFLTDMDIEINQGTNLISIPLILSNNDVNSVFNDPAIVSVKEYDGGNIIEATTIENNKGYFVECNSDINLVVKGEVPTEEQNIELDEGMNLIGLTSLSNFDLDDFNTDAIIEIARRNSDGSYDISTKYTNWENKFPLEPGKGYWFKTNKQDIWTYST